MVTFTGFFKSAGNEDVYIGAVKGDGFEIMLETRSPDEAESALRDLIPVEKPKIPFHELKEDFEPAEGAKVDFDDEGE
jgi:hypothetical protein